MLVHKLTYGSIFHGVEICSDSEFFLLSLKKSKKQLVITSQENYSNLDEFTKNIKGQKHMHLTINHHKVLTKFTRESHIAKESIVKSAFPNINLSDFYFDILEVSDGNLVSICRKQDVDTILKDFEVKGLSVMGFSLGNSNIKRLIPYLFNSKAYTNNAYFLIDADKITEYKKIHGESESYNLNGLQLSSNYLLSFAGILSYFTGALRSEDRSKQFVSTYREKRVFQLSLYGGLGVLLLSLLINFFVFSSYREKVATLQEDLTISEAYKKQLLSLDDITSRKKQLVESITDASNSKVIWYYDQIAGSVPNTISLDKMEYQPLLRVIRKDSPILTSKDMMILKGIAKDDSDLTVWLSDLETQPWISKTTVNISGDKSKFSAFELVLELNKQIR